MKAATHTEYGTPRVLRIEQVEQPKLAAKQILVKVHASAVTHGDRRLRAADFPGIGAVVGRLMFGVFRPRNPIPGTNFAGRVVQVGKEVTKFKVGDDVFGGCDNGAQAEYLAVAEDSTVARMPEGISYEDAAATPYGAVTALTFIRDLAAVGPGDRVLVLGASGGVGRFAVQIARHLGAEVTGVCSSTKVNMVKELGAQHVIDYTQVDYTKNGKTYDVIFDTVSGNGFRAAKGSLSARGHYLSLYMSTGIVLQMLRGAIFGGRRASSGVALGNQQQTEEVAALLAEGAISPVIAARFPLEQVVEAHEAVEKRELPGSVVVSMLDAPRDGGVVWAAE